MATDLIRKIQRLRDETETLGKGLRHNLPKDQHDNLRRYGNLMADLGQANQVQFEVNRLTADGSS